MRKPIVSSRIDINSHEKLKAISRTFDTPISDLLRRSVREFLRNFKPGKIIEPLDKPDKK